MASWMLTWYLENWVKNKNSQALDLFVHGRSKWITMMGLVDAKWEKSQGGREAHWGSARAKSFTFSKPNIGREMPAQDKAKKFMPSSFPVIAEEKLLLKKENRTAHGIR